jgi:N-acetyl sugar amidotransferase
MLCNNCVLSTEDDSSLTLDDCGICNYCNEYKLEHSNKIPQSIEKIIAKIQQDGKNNTHNCIIGVSGGVDSTYLTYKAHQYGLKPLLIHYDNGWNSSEAVQNINKLVEKFNFDLFTYVNDWQEFKDIQLAFMKASVIDIELVTDHALVAILLKEARRRKIKHLLTGHNSASEAILPKSWYHWKNDSLNIRAIHKKFGSLPMKTYPYLSFWENYIIEKRKLVNNVHLLNVIDYNKEDAKKLMISEIGWKDYGGKHFESIFTRFYQGYILPVKFGVDKRKAHLSTLINSGQISREDALEELKNPPYKKEILDEDKQYVLKKLNISEKEFQDIMNLPVKKHTDYPSFFNKHYKWSKMLGKKFGDEFYFDK